MRDDIDTDAREKHLDVRGEITAITLDSNVVIYVGKNREYQFRIENEFTVANSNTDSGFVVRFDPYNRVKPVHENVTELARIIGSTVLSAKTQLSGELRLSLSNGDDLTVEPEQKIEAWSFSFGNYILVCPPGGFAHLP